MTVRAFAVLALFQTFICFQNATASESPKATSLQIEISASPNRVMTDDVLPFRFQATVEVPGNAPLDLMEWSFDDGTKATGLEASHFFETPGWHVVWFRARSGEMAAEKRLTVYRAVLPTAKFTASVTEGILPVTIQFTDTSLEGNTPIGEWHWNFGDNTDSVEQNPEHEYNSCGNIFVTLTVRANTAPLGEVIESSPKQVMLTLKGRPYANFVPVPARGDAPLQVQFNNTSFMTTGCGRLAGLSLWDFGDSSTSTDPAPRHGFALCGVYPVSLAVTSEEGVENATSKEITVTQGFGFAWPRTEAIVWASSEINPLPLMTACTQSCAHTTHRASMTLDGEPVADDIPVPGILEFDALRAETIFCDAVLSEGDEALATAQTVFTLQEIAETQSIYSTGLPPTFADVFNMKDAQWHWNDGGDGATAMRYWQMRPQDGEYPLDTGKIGNTLLRVHATATPENDHVPLAILTVMHENALTQLLRADGMRSLPSILPNQRIDSGYFLAAMTRYTENAGLADMPNTPIQMRITGLTLNPAATYEVLWSPVTFRADGKQLDGWEQSSATWASVTPALPADTTDILEFTLPEACVFAIVEGGAPLANFNAQPVSGYVPLLVNFTDTSQAGSSPIIEWAWDFGDETGSPAQNTDHLYLNPGTFPARLSITTAVGTSETLHPTTITAWAKPRPSFTTDTAECQLPHCQIQFTDTSQPGSSPISGWIWDFGDGGRSDLRNPSHSYAAPGIYSVRLTVTDGGIEVTTEQAVLISVIAPTPPVAKFTADPLRGYAPLTVRFNDQSEPGNTPISEYEWVFGDGETGTGRSPEHTYQTPGDYIVRLIVRSDSGNASADQTVHVSTLPVVSLYANPMVGFAPLEVTVLNTSEFTADVTGWEWSFGDETNSDTQTANHVYANPGTYTLRLTAQLPDRTMTSEASIQVSAPPTPVFTTSQTLGFAPMAVQFADETVIESASAERYWDFGDGAHSSLANPTHEYGTPGTYSVSLALTIGDRVFVSDDTQIVVHAAPQVQFTATAVDENDPFLITFANTSIIVPETVVSLLWDFGDGQTSTESAPTHRYAAAGEYTTRLTLYTMDGQNTSTTVRVTVKPTAIIEGESVPEGEIVEEGEPIAPQEGATADGELRPEGESTLDTEGDDASTTPPKPILGGNQMQGMNNTISGCFGQ